MATEKAAEVREVCSERISNLRILKTFEVNFQAAFQLKIFNLKGSQRDRGPLRFSREQTAGEARLGSLDLRFQE